MSSDPKRDDWMTADSFDALLSSSSTSNRQKKEDQRQQQAKLKEGEVHSRELNPNLRKDAEKSELKPPVVASSSSWQRMLVQKSLDRIKRGEGSFEEIAVERFGSVQAFEEACRAARIDIASHLRRTDRNIPHESNRRLTDSDDKEKPETEFAGENVNKLTARKLKAEMMGDRALAKQLEDQITKLSRQESKIQILPGEVERKRALNEDSTIAQMVQHEKLASSHELDEELAGRIAKDARFSTRQEDFEEFGDRYGEERGSFSSKKKAKREEKDVKGAAIDRLKRMERIQKNCWFCQDSGRADKSLIIAYGQYTYLALPKSGQLDPLHCQIVPLEHCSSLLQASDQEAVWDELRNFKKCLLKMAAERGQRIVFLEASLNFDRSRHAFIDAIPLPASLNVDPMGYFKKALLECDAEWAQHKKIFDTSDPASGGLRKLIPKNFPYLYVDFRLDQGYAHVVEDEERIGPDYLRWLTAGLIGAGSDYKSKMSNADAKAGFTAAYDPLDWTKLLHTQ